MSNLYARLAVLLTSAFRSGEEADRGASAVEYGLLIALIAAVIVAIVAGLGQQVLNAFTSVNNAL